MKLTPEQDHWYTEGYNAGFTKAHLNVVEEVSKLKHDINILNSRLLERQESFNVADRRKVARIQELELEVERLKREIKRFKPQWEFAE